MKADNESDLEAAPTLCPLSIGLEPLPIKTFLFDVTINKEVLGHYSQ